MPLIKIELAKGKSKDFLNSFMNITMECVQKVLNLASNYKNIRLQEYEKENFFMKPPYQFIIEINMIKGRSQNTKKDLFKLIVNNLSDELGIKKEEILILINEQKKENWGIRGGISATEIF